MTPIQLSESQPLSRFVYDQAWTPLKGAYIFPLKYFAVERSYDPNDYLEVIRVIDVVGADVAITRGGGLFVRTPLESGVSASRVAEVLNLLLCQFALCGLASHPITDTDVQDGKLIGRHASITEGWGAHGERTWGPFSLLAAGVRDMGAPFGRAGNDYWPVNFYWTTHDPKILDWVSPITDAVKLADTSSSLPALLVGAAHHCSRHNVAETTITAWIICEQVLSYFWDKYVDDIANGNRRTRLQDARTYGAAVRAEVLLTAGCIPEETCALVQAARKVRNELAHRAKVSEEAATVAMDALRSALEWLGVSADRLPGYSRQSGGIGQPAQAVAPEFPFQYMT